MFVLEQIVNKAGVWSAKVSETQMKRVFDTSKIYAKDFKNYTTLKKFILAYFGIKLPMLKDLELVDVDRKYHIRTYTILNKSQEYVVVDYFGGRITFKTKAAGIKYFQSLKQELDLTSMEYQECLYLIEQIDKGIRTILKDYV